MGIRNLANTTVIRYPGQLTDESSICQLARAAGSPNSNALPLSPPYVYLHLRYNSVAYIDVDSAQLGFGLYYSGEQRSC